MNFMNEIIAYSMQAWQDAANCRFLQELGAGTLAKEKFRNYIVQDSIYLRDYLKAFGYALVKSPTLKEMQLYYGILGYVNDGENATRLAYLKDFGLTDADVDRMEKKPQCENYTRFLIKVGQGGDLPDILMVVLPCMLGYHYVFSELLAHFPHVMEGYYGPLVADYTNTGYKEACEIWKGMTNEMCEGLASDRKEELKLLFYQASLHELWFWQMAGEE